MMKTMQEAPDNWIKQDNRNLRACLRSLPRKEEK